MEISKDIKEYLVKILRVAKLLKIENVIIEKDSVRGILKEEGMLFIHNKDLPNFSFQSLGISRASVLSARIDLIKDNFDLSYEEKNKDENNKIVTKLIISNKKTEIEFKCAAVDLMEQVKKQLNDVTFFSFECDDESLTILEKAHRVIATGEGNNSTLTLIGMKDKGVKCKLSDIDGDQLTHKITKELIIHSECDREKFSFSYKNKNTVPMLKELAREGKVIVNITKRGIMKLLINGVDVFITPEI